MKKRDFIKQAGKTTLGALTLSAAACAAPEQKPEATRFNLNKTYKWKMTTTWPPNFPVLGEGCKLMAQWIEQMSGGRMQITVFGGGELIPALEGFDAVSNGAVEMNHGGAYYWGGKIPSAPFFAAVPFGMNSQQITSWILSGGGQALWEELYAPYNLIPMISGNTGMQAGGWFNKEINSLADIKGLKMRIPGLGGKVFAKAGGSPVTVSGGEIYTNLERGVIDATEWIGPYHDYLMGFQDVAKYCYYPGWHETGSALELIVNRDKFMELPADLQEIIRTACHRLNRWILAEFDAKNGEYLTRILQEGRVQLKRFPDEVIEGFRSATQELLQELVESDAKSRQIFEKYEAFRKQMKTWGDISEKEFYQRLG